MLPVVPVKITLDDRPAVYADLYNFKDAMGVPVVQALIAKLRHVLHTSLQPLDQRGSPVADDINPQPLPPKGINSNLGELGGEGGSSEIGGSGGAGEIGGSGGMGSG